MRIVFSWKSNKTYNLSYRIFYIPTFLEHIFICFVAHILLIRKAFSVLHIRFWSTCSQLNCGCCYTSAESSRAGIKWMTIYTFKESKTNKLLTLISCLGSQGHIRQLWGNRLSRTIAADPIALETSRECRRSMTLSEEANESGFFPHVTTKYQN